MVAFRSSCGSWQAESPRILELAGRDNMALIVVPKRPPIPRQSSHKAPDLRFERLGVEQKTVMAVRRLDFEETRIGQQSMKTALVSGNVKGVRTDGDDQYRLPDLPEHVFINAAVASQIVSVHGIEQYPVAIGVKTLDQGLSMVP